MKLTTRQDIEAPMDFVFAQLTDFDQFERMAMRRGAEIERVDRLTQPGPGMAWRLKFRWRGKARNLVLRYTEGEPGSHLSYGVEGDAILGAVRVDLMALAPKRTRLTIQGEVKPKTLAARLVLQSFRLARGRMLKRVDGAAGKLAVLIEDKFRGGSALPR
ncbi:SRPBCC family protein [Xinfangfangia pollutisoli]|uniref:SRPBCC family protein n=1 Tax=Xinfangfangia pollutisoli TaxID=2865960 RepID=UPI001CD75219|nr:SRPBCC family protein [Xinfangfangia pollutisoli]